MSFGAMTGDVEGLFIDGKWTVSSASEWFDVINPATEAVIFRVPKAAPADVKKAIDAAERALPGWRKTLAWERSAILRKASELIRQRSQELARALTLEQGKPIAEATREIGMAADHFEWASEEAKRIYGTTIDVRPAGTSAVVRQEPVGVVAALTPWNFPALQTAAKVSYALAAGCTVVHKPSEETPATSIGLVKALQDAGIPDGVVNLVVGDPREVSEVLFASPVVRAVSFTGSTAVGKQLMAQAAPYLKRLTMELGGHAPLIVMPDVDPRDVARQAAAIKFRNAGQACVSPSRFYIHRDIYKPFREALVEVAESIKVGDGLDPATTMGPLSNERRLAATAHLVKDSVSNGASLLAGGRNSSNLDKGFFYDPTVIADVDGDCEIMRNEPFAPIAALQPVDGIEEAISMANSLPYGLAAYAFTNSAADMARLSGELEAGMVAINNFALASAETPFGGIKESGFGREGGPTAINEFLELKLVKTMLASV